MVMEELLISLESKLKHVLEQHLVLAAFIPLVVYMSDAVGTQLEAFTIRDFSQREKIPLGRYIFRQATTLICIALFTGSALFGVSSILHHDVRVALVLMATLILAMLSALTTGIGIPLLMSRLRTDPADASGPISTLVQEILSIVIYFAVASALLPPV